MTTIINPAVSPKIKSILLLPDAEASQEIYDLMLEYTHTWEPADFIKYFYTPVYNFTYSYCWENNIEFPELAKDYPDFFETLCKKEWFFRGSLEESLADDHLGRLIVLFNQASAGAF